MLKNIKISTKVFAGFGIILALLVVLAVVGGMSLNTAGDYFSDYREAARARNASNRVGFAMQRVRVNVRNFILAPSDEQAKQTQERLDTLDKEVDEQIKFLEFRKDLQDKSRSLDANVKEWKSLFTDLVAHQKHRTEVVDGKLDVLGPKMEKTLSGMVKNAVSVGNAEAAAKIGELTLNLMRGRVAVVKFLLENKPEQADRVRSELKEMGEDVAALLPELKVEENRKLLTEVDEECKAYLAAFEDVVKTIGERNDIFKVKMTALGNAIVKTGDEITGTLRDFQDALGPKAQAAISAAVTTTIVVALVAVVIGILAAWFIGMGISRPVVAMTAAMQRLANKDMTAEIPAKDHKDEVGSMAAAVQVFKDNMIRADQLAAEAAREQEARNRRAAAVDNLTKKFDSDASSVLNTVSSAATELESTSTSMSATAEETSKQATTVAAAAEQASTNVQTVASAAEELSNSIQEISRQVTKSTEIAGKAVNEAKRTHDTVQGLAQAASKIGEVVELITDIAEQTNLLALNATIEAARAGDAGKGFAVVASEVKNLANQTARATEEIGAQIGSVQTATQDAVKAIEGISVIIQEINEIATAIASAVEEQGAATQEIARNVEQAATGTQEVSSTIVGVNQAAGETGAASGQVLEASRELARQAEGLKGIVQKFLHDVRSA